MKDIFTKKFLAMLLMLTGIFAIGITIQHVINPQQLPKVTKSQIEQLESERFTSYEAAEETVKNMLAKGVKNPESMLSKIQGTPDLGFISYYDGQSKDYLSFYYILGDKDALRVKVGKVNVTYQKGDKKMWTEKVDGKTMRYFLNDHRRFKSLEEQNASGYESMLHNNGMLQVIVK